MAGVDFFAQTDEAVPVLATRTVILLAKTQVPRVKFNGISVSFKGITPTDPPVLVEVCRYSSDGSGGSSLTPNKRVSSDPETIQTIFTEDFTGSSAVQPTVSGTAILKEEIHPQEGVWFPLLKGKELVAVGGGERLGVQVTFGSASIVKVVVRLEGEE